LPLAPADPADPPADPLVPPPPDVELVVLEPLAPLVGPDPLCVVDPPMVVVEAAPPEPAVVDDAAPPDPEAGLPVFGSDVSEQPAAITKVRHRMVDFIHSAHVRA
jgi:hypothetical protein